MPKLPASSLTLVALVLLSAAAGGAEVGTSFRLVERTDAYPIARQIRYGFTLRNETNRTVSAAELRASAPVRQTSFQQCLRVETSHPGELTADERGNQVLRFSFVEVPPYGTKVVWVKAELAMSDVPNPASRTDAERYLRPERHIESDAPAIAELAERLAVGPKRQLPERIYRWVSENLGFSGYRSQDRGALSALVEKKGDCSEFTNLFVALCRAAGTPARPVTGFVYDADAVLQPGAFHSWAEFYEGGSWRLVDAQRKVFGTNSSWFIATAVLAGAGPIPDGRFFEVSTKDISARMTGGLD